MATQVSETGGKTRTRGTADELAVIAQRAQAFTSASGTAIALSEGSGDEIICRARSGASSPEVGTALRVEGSFTGLCIQSGKELRCDDAETDTRVDTAAIRALGIRSMVVTPIKEENRVVGVLAVFAPTAHAFTITHVAVLKTMADQIAQLLQRERRTREEGSAPESPALVPVALARSAAPTATPVIPAPVVIKPAVSVPAPAPRAVPPAVTKVEPIRASAVIDSPVAPAAPRAVPPAVTKVEPIRASAVIDSPVAPAAPPKREERRIEPKPQPQAQHISFGTFEAVGEKTQKSGNRWVFVLAALLVIAAVAAFAYLKMHRQAPAQHGQAPAPPVAAVQPAPAPAPASNTGSDANGAASVSTPSAPLAKPRDEGAESSKKADKTSKPSPVAPESKRAPEAVALAQGPSRIPGASGDSAQAGDAPSLTVGGASASGSLNSLTSPTADRTPSMLTQSTLEPLKVIKRVAPVYPTVARQRLLSGTVVVEALVDQTGKVKQVNMISGSPIFRDAALDAVKQWQYQPARLNGEPIEQKTTIQLFFKP